MAEKKLMTYVVVAVLAGALVGVGIGYAAFNNGGETQETYWYYLDYGTKVDSTHVNKWISADAKDVISGMKAALDKAGIAYVISDSGWITTINGISGSSATNTSWTNWFWDKTEYKSTGVSVAYPNWIQTPGMNVTVGSAFYLGFTAYDPVTYAYLMDPNSSVTGWGNTGPFASA